jgi:hypothetical protein
VSTAAARYQRETIAFNAIFILCEERSMKAITSLVSISSAWTKVLPCRGPAIGVALATVVTLALATMSEKTAPAAILLEVVEEGSDVVISYSGSWDTWSSFGSSSTTNREVSSTQMLAFSGSQRSDIGGLSKQSGLWTSRSTTADSGVGDLFGFNSSTTYAPSTYVAGNPISGSIRFNNETLDSMGFTLGDSGTFSGDGKTVNYTVSAVPEPVAIGTALVGMAGLALGYCRRRCRNV